MEVPQGELMVLLDESPPASLFGVVSEHDSLWEQVEILAKQEMENKDGEKRSNLLADSGPTKPSSPRSLAPASPAPASPTASPAEARSGEAKGETKKGNSSLPQGEEGEAKRDDPATPEQTKAKDRQKRAKKGRIPPSEVASTLLVQPRRSARNLRHPQTTAPHVSSKTAKSNNATSKAQEPMGSIITLFASVSSPKKLKTARAPPQHPNLPEPPSWSAENEHSADNGSLALPEAEHSTINLPSQKLEKPTSECRKT